MQAVDQEVIALERMWGSHQDSVRRLLIALGRDIDLADDLLQETYLHARAGISSYRGGDARAWLTAIARNVFQSHMRRRYTQVEVRLDSEHGAISGATSTCDCLELLAIRQAMAGLPHALRTALIMKHYGGFTYQEIAGHTRCAVGTAKWRVSEALQMLRAVLRPERRMAMAGCGEASGISIVDYVYDLASEEVAAKVKAHLAECKRCREEAKEVRRVVSMLDALEGDHKMMHLVDLDEEGVPTVYVTWTCMNMHDQPIETVTFQSDKDWRLDDLYQDGEEIAVKVEPCAAHGNLNYTATLAQPVPPGQRVNMLSVCRAGAGWAAQRLEDGRFRLRWKQGPGSNETAYVQVIRLPAGGHLLTADPQPGETRGNGATTLIWRRVIPPHEFFDCTVEYRQQKAR